MKVSELLTTLRDINPDVPVHILLDSGAGEDEAVYTVDDALDSAVRENGVFTPSIVLVCGREV
jgi:hypothetical protein